MAGATPPAIAMGARHVLILLSPTRLSAAPMLRGVVGAPAHTDLDANEWSGAWDAGLRPLDDRLREAMSRAGVAPGAGATLLHLGPDAAAEAGVYPTAPGAALRAAALTSAESDEAGRERVSCAVALRRETGGGAARTHVLVATDSADKADIAAGWLVRAGLRVCRVAPLEASLIGAALRAAEAPGRTGAHATLYVGDDGAALVGCEGGCVRFVRRVGFSTETLAEALTRPIRARGSDEARPLLGLAEARALIARVGVPERETVVDEAKGLSGADLLPVLQPALQRCAIETKQSIRFGLSEAAKGAVTLHLRGPGAAIRRLAPVLAEQAQAALGDDAPAPASPTAGMQELLDALPAGVNLLGPGASARARLGVARRALRVGAAAALLAACADAGVSLIGLRATRAELAAIEASSGGGAAAAEWDRVGSVERGVREAERDIAEAHEWVSSFPAWLAEVSRRTPDAIRVTCLTGRYESGKGVAEIEGLATTPPAHAAGAGGPLKQYIDALGACPLVGAVQLAAAQRVDADGVDAQRFTLRVTLRPAPPAFVRGASPREHGGSE